MRYLNFDKQEKGYEPFQLSRSSAKQNIGKRIVYLRGADIDHRRGWAFPRYGTISAVQYSQVIFENGDSIDIRSVEECGIKI